ncbi:hypothetical protein [Sediminibacillus albus]|uniref:Glycine zipper-like domain-containing protein n=1 Tax=Sediminibacillus albus TaxID=407036 RepID=A0A1G8X7K1_9BACI|nr:hypothetical protein [Sediminibacillus albus]SDJ86286.1 hypothetical protein SAMN05216243_1199 [Sediminibacillus albus]
MAEKKHTKSNFGWKVGVVVASGVVFGMLMDNIAIGIALGVVFSVAIPDKKEK